MESNLITKDDKIFKGPFTFLEVEYGKTESDVNCLLKMKIVMILIDQLAEKEISGKNENANDLITNKSKKYYSY